MVYVCALAGVIMLVPLVQVRQRHPPDTVL
jgi:hypothetical protein